MPSWTKEQELAIDKSGCNIIVSAGAGSGKTAVLTERVIRKLKNGVDISRLLILTFTNAAALEMKERIRSAIKKEGLKDQLEKIDSSYITTFDSFALQTLKKYHYLLNLDSDIEISNDLILKWKKEEILDDIFSELYEKEDELFLKLIKDFTIKDDKLIENAILEIANKLELKYDLDTYLNNYIDNYYSDSYVDNEINSYLEILLLKIEDIRKNLQEIELIADGDCYFKLYDSLKPLIDSNSYFDIKNNLDIKLPRLSKGMEEVKTFKEKISEDINNLKKLSLYDDIDEIKNSIKATKDYVIVIVNILKELFKRFENYKRKNNLYDFLDVSKLAIKILETNESVRLELKEYFTEILVDEYQDTSDLQELFISFISNNNIYMVGDIKQSIYRFRNANPNLFKEKYVNYEKNIGGFKIDLVKNFRSREEVLDNINYVFDYIMDLDLGGADYKKSHRMVFGNTLYNEFKNENQNNDFEIYNYEVEKQYTKDETEAFIVLNDIKDKVNNKYQVYDKNKNCLRDITYDDFVILIDKSTSFSLYKKIFEYNSVSLTIIKDENINGSYDLYILKNILILIDKIKENKFDTTFKYAYLSVGRSYLFNIDDNILYNDIKSNQYFDSKIIFNVKNIVKNLDNLPVNKLINEIIREFSFYEKLISVGNINESIIRLDYLENLFSNLGELGYTYKDLITYLEKIIENNEVICYSLNKNVLNSVKIMTIHKSKGLEYPICYYTGLTNKFNTVDSKKRFLFDNRYGIITPYLKNNLINNTIYHILYRISYTKEDISERIRLFYVALTRAREKMILVTSLKNSDEVLELVELDTRLKYQSFASILNSISDKLTNYIKDIDLNSVGLTKNYTMFKKENYKEKIDMVNEKIKVEELDNYSDIIETKHFSKNNNLIITKDIKDKLEFGKYLHYLFEIVDFNTKDLTNIPSIYHNYFYNFFKVFDFKNANIYKEYEFIYETNNIKYHGIIDLLAEYDNHIDIIDYKLKNIDDKSYHNQLRGYQNYIESRFKKQVNIYLYSIIDSKVLKIDYSSNKVSNDTIL